MHVIVKLFPEIAIKTAPVRQRMVRQLRDNLRRLTQGQRVQVKSGWDNIEVTAAGDDDERDARVLDILACTPGIANFSVVYPHPLGSYDAMTEQTWAHYGPLLANRSFCVRAKRTGRHDFTSANIERELGARLLRRADNAHVKLVDPEVTVRVDVRDAAFYVIEQTRPGLGGFPLGTQDAVLSLISGGFDSTVATYLAMKRGLRTHFCFFSLGGQAHEVGVKATAHYLWSKFGASHLVKFVTVPFEEVVAEILAKVDNAYMGVVLKRMMLRAAGVVAQDWEVEALMTGESVAQVSSQTLANLAVIDAATDMLVLRPLATMAKGDIIDIARHIGAAELAANMPEYCGVISVRPTTRAKLDRVLHAEGCFDFAVLDAAVACRRAEDIHSIIAAEAAGSTVEVFCAPQPDAVILDIRHPDEALRAPLTAGAALIQQLPFYRLQQEFAALDQRQRYLLYCEKGVMSQLQAELLRDQGFTNTAIYRP